MKNPICPIPPPERRAQFFTELYAMGCRRHNHPTVEAGVPFLLVRCTEESFTHVMVQQVAQRYEIVFRNPSEYSHIKAHRLNEHAICNSHRDLIAYLRAHIRP